MSETLVLRGRATPEEIAAVLAVVRGGGATPEPDAYEVWRRARLAATAPPRTS